MINTIILLSFLLYIISQVSTPISFTNPGTGYSISGNIFTITSDGTYELTGSQTNKQIIVASLSKIYLNSFSLINNDNLTPLIINSNKNVEIILQEESTLQDSSTNSNNGIIYLQSYSSLIISGTGTLNLNPNKQMALSGQTSSSFIGDEGANIKISSNSQNVGGIYSLGKINFNNLIFIYSCPNGRYNALYSKEEIRIIKGVYNITSGRGKGIMSSGNIYLGEENGLNDSDLVLNIETLEDGIEGMKLVINSGIFNINSGEEGINIDSENDLCDDNIKCSGNCACSLTIKKGNLTLISKEDGLNVNGVITFSGGNIIIFSSGSLDAKPIEQDGLFQINGGNIISAGISRTLGLYANTTQVGKIYSGTVNSGQNLEIFVKKNNNKIIGLNIPRDVNNIYFNFPEDFTVKINNADITTTSVNNNTNNNRRRRYDDDDDDWDDDDWDDDDFVNYKSGSYLKLLNIEVLLFIMALI